MPLSHCENSSSLFHPGAFHSRESGDFSSTAKRLPCVSLAVGLRGGPEGAVWRRARCCFVEGMIRSSPGERSRVQCVAHILLLTCEMSYLRVCCRGRIAMWSTPVPRAFCRRLPPGSDVTNHTRGILHYSSIQYSVHLPELILCGFDML